MSELLPCPFCGGEARKSGERFENTILSWVYCSSCGAAGGYRHSEAEAIEAWNTRHKSVFVTGTTVATDGEPVTYMPTRTCENAYEYRDSNGVLHRDARLFKCSECGFKVNDFYGDDEQSFPRYCPNCGRKVIA